MPNKVRVYGKAQNRTALGLMHAYLVMNPHSTMKDLEKAFPKGLNPDSGWPVNFKDKKTLQLANENDFWFKEDDEVLKLQDGTKVATVKMWTKGSFENLVAHAKQYDIEVAQFEKGQKGEKGGFRLEYLNGYVPPKKTSSMSFFDSFKKTVKKTVEDASKTLSIVAEDASKKITTVSDDVSKKVSSLAEDASKKISTLANDATKAVSSAKDTTYERIRVITITKIRSMIRGLNLQSVIDSLNKVSKEKNIDVSNLVAFIEDLKKYGENGE